MGARHRRSSAFTIGVDWESLEDYWGRIGGLAIGDGNLQRAPERQKTSASSKKLVDTWWLRVYLQGDGGFLPSEGAI